MSDHHDSLRVAQLVRRDALQELSRLGLLEAGALLCRSGTSSGQGGMLCVSPEWVFVVSGCPPTPRLPGLVKT